MNQSEYLDCIDCGTQFEFSGADQEFYTGRGFEKAKRCKECRIKKKQRYENRRENQ